MKRTNCEPAQQTIQTVLCAKVKELRIAEDIRWSQRGLRTRSLIVPVCSQVHESL